MASIATVSLGDYLSTDYHPDCEYIDGELKEKPVVGFAHGELQTILGVWFWNRREEWNIKCAVETRTQVGVAKVRLPDFVVVSSATREQGALTEPPLIAIEVLSRSDTYADLRARAADLAAMGVQNVWLLDPETRTAEVWREGHWQPVAGDRLNAVESPIYLDLKWVWKELGE